MPRRTYNGDVCTFTTLMFGFEECAPCRPQGLLFNRLLGYFCY